MTETVKIITPDKLLLKGYILKGNDTLVVYFHGFAGWYDSLAKSIEKMCEQNNFSFLFPFTRGTGDIQTLTRIDNSLLNGGGCYENLNEYQIDYLSWFEYIKTLSKKHLILIGHSLACNKLVDFLNMHKIIADALFMLAPQDLTHITEEHLNLLQEAKSAINPEKILSEKFLGFCDICARTFLSFSPQNPLHNLAYKDQKSNFEKLEHLTMPIFCIIGDNDQGLKGENAINCMQTLKNHSKNLEFQVIKDCKHVFSHHEEEVASIIKSKIKEII